MPAPTPPTVPADLNALLNALRSSVDTALQCAIALRERAYAAGDEHLVGFADELGHELAFMRERV